MGTGLGAGMDNGWSGTFVGKGGIFFSGVN